MLATLFLTTTTDVRNVPKTFGGDHRRLAKVPFVETQIFPHATSVAVEWLVVQVITARRSFAWAALALLLTNTATLADEARDVEALQKLGATIVRDDKRLSESVTGSPTGSTRDDDT